MNQCCIVDCAIPYYAKGYCKKHYQRIAKTGTPHSKIKDNRSNCITEGCNNVQVVLTWCKKHYDQQRHINKPISAEANHLHHIKYRYGITKYQYLEKLNSQKGLCFICENPETVIDKRNNVLKKLSVDHCHKTGKIRELLCNSCNLAIARLEENLHLLDKMKAYLNVHS